jgi:hypothetical protein
MRNAKVVSCVLALSFFLIGCGNKRGGSLVGIPDPNTNAHGVASRTPTESTKTPGPLATITITPNSLPDDLKMATNQTIVFTAHGADANGNSVPVLEPQWSCPPPAGKISNTGQFTAQGTGDFQPCVTVVSGGIAGSVNISINGHGGE